MKTKSAKKTASKQQGDDSKWGAHFVLPIAKEMQRRGIRELRITLTERGTAAFELIPQNS